MVYYHFLCNEYGKFFSIRWRWWESVIDIVQHAAETMKFFFYNWRYPEHILKKLWLKMTSMQENDYNFHWTSCDSMKNHHHERDDSAAFCFGPWAQNWPEKIMIVALNWDGWESRKHLMMNWWTSDARVAVLVLCWCIMGYAWCLCLRFMVSNCWCILTVYIDHNILVF